jgi:hypothetical protein
MKLSKKQHLTARWTARILAAATILFGLPFYFGYGNPLPFFNPGYSLWDNIWLAVFPLIFIGLGLGLKFERIGGYLVTISITIGFLLGLITRNDMSVNMIIPFLAGVMYLLSGYSKETR